MAELHVKINWTKRTARFSGPGTFAAKERIKQLGSARWNGAEKSWEISSFERTPEDVLRMLPEVSEIEEEGSRAEKPEDSPSFSFDAPQPSAPGGSSVPKSYSVSELVSRIRGLLRDSFPRTIFVRGVLCSAKVSREGRVFMDLAEEDKPEETISCVIWRDADKICLPLEKAGFRLEPQLQVMFEVQVDVGRRRSNLCLSVTGVVPEYTIGKLAALRDITNERLKEEGLFSRNKQLQLSFLPIRLGILTSAGGTVINDFRASLDASRFGFELFWADTSVQGAAARGELLHGLKRLLSVPDLDAVLIFRGGGSASDLAVFNDYEFARAVCLCPLPVISAIGHEEDQSSVQDVSFIACGVPKDIGRLFAELIADRRRGAGQALRTICSTAGQTVELERQRLAHLSQALHGFSRQTAARSADMLIRLQLSVPMQGRVSFAAAVRHLAVLASPVGPLGAKSSAFAERGCHAAVWRILSGAKNAAVRAAMKLQAAGERSYIQAVRRFDVDSGRCASFADIPRKAAAIMERRAEQLQNFGEKLDAASPQAQLRRGFSLVKRPGSSGYITSGAALEKDEIVEILFLDQSREAKVV